MAAMEWFGGIAADSRYRKRRSKRHMKTNKKRLCAVWIAALCCISLVGGCGAKEKENSQENLSGNLAGEDAKAGQEGTEGQTGTVGEFSTQDVEGETYTQEMFADYGLTLVNAFTTWCSPCVNEIPDLEKLHNEMKEKGVNVVGVVLDAADGSGGTDAEVVEKARLLAEKTGATYPFLIPDEGNLNGRLSGIMAVPETFFVDKEGNIVGETYSGSRSLEEWEEIVETELEGVGE